MTTIIDSFVIELGLDPSKFTKEQAKVYEQFKKFEKDQLASAKSIEHNSGKAADAIGALRSSALAMFAAFTGGKGLVDFTTGIVQSNAALGRLERNIGVSARTINIWQGAARIFGGDAQQMANTFTTISDAYAGFKIGVVSPMIADLRAISAAGGHLIDVNDSIEQSFVKLSANLKAIHDKDPATAGLMGRRLGLDPAFFDLLLQGPDKVRAIVREVERMGGATRESTEAAGELAKAWNAVGVAIDAKATKLLSQKSEGGFSVAGGIADFLQTIAKDMSTERKWVNPLDETSFSQLWESLKQGLTWTPSKTGSLQGQTAFSGFTTGAFKSLAEKEAFIRAEAAKRGINPNVAMAVAKSEGFNNFRSTIPGETSYGAFQLHVTPGGRGGHLGDQFRNRTDLDPSDPNNERAGIQFALDDVQKNGWKAFHGARNTGISQWQGVAGGSANPASTTEVNINSVTVVAPQSNDPNAWATSFTNAVKNRSFAGQANTGQN